MVELIGVKIEDILRLVNASNKPYSGAYCTFEDESLQFGMEIVEDKEIFSAIPGQILKIEDKFIEVSCSNGKLRLLKAEYKGQVAFPSEFKVGTKETFMISTDNKALNLSTNDNDFTIEHYRVD